MMKISLRTKYLNIYGCPMKVDENKNRIKKYTGFQWDNISMRNYECLKGTIKTFILAVALVLKKQKNKKNDNL